MASTAFVPCCVGGLRIAKQASTVFVEIAFPEDVYLTLTDSGLAREQLASRARQLLAVRFFDEKLLSLGKAARLAGLDRWRFIDLLGAHGVPVIDLDEEEFAREMAVVDELASALQGQESS